MNIIHPYNNVNFGSVKNNYEFIPFHPVSVTSEMLGTSIEELYQHNNPNKRSWECSRLCSFPQEIIIRLNKRSHVKYILLRSKINRPSPEVMIYLADGGTHSYLDISYRKLTVSKEITDEGQTIKVDGIGNYIKIIFTKQSQKTLDNPFGQVSLSQCKFFGKEINHLQYYDEMSSNICEEDKGNIDSILIELGLPLNDPVFFITDSNYEIAPVDENTKMTLKDLILILKRSEYAKDYEMMKRIKTDIKQIFLIGNEILRLERELGYSKAKENFEKCIEIREKLNILNKKRDSYDIVYETSRFEKLIAFDRPSTADILAEEENLLKKQKVEKKEIVLKKEEEKIERNDNRMINKGNTSVSYQDNSKYVSYIKSDVNSKKNEVSEDYYNQGDKDLEPYFNPFARKAKTKLEIADKTSIEKLKRLQVLNIAGVRLFSAMLSLDWTLREAAILAFHEFLKSPLLPRYNNKTINLFNCAVELSKIGVEDKINQIYIESLQVISTALNPPICGEDISPSHIQKQIKYFIPIIIKKISELNLRQRDHSLITLISIFKHPALNIGELVKGCLDIIERKDGITPDKQPAFVLLARLEIVLRVIEEYGVDNSLWDWYPVFNELIIPSLFHSSPDCKLVSQQITILLYQIIGEDIKIMIEDPMKSIKPQIRNQILQRIKEISISNKRLKKEKADDKSIRNNNENSIYDNNFNSEQRGLKSILENVTENENQFDGSVSLNKEYSK